MYLKRKIKYYMLSLAILFASFPVLADEQVIEVQEEIEYIPEEPFDQTIETDDDIFYIAEEPFTWFHPFITLTGGAVGARIKEKEAFFIWDQNGYLFKVDNTGLAETEFGGFVGNAFPYFNADWGIENSDWEVQLGFAYYQMSSVEVRGTLSQGSDVVRPLEWQQFDYRYKILSRQALFEAKLVASWYEILHPYIEAGVGASFNNAHHYSVTFISANPAEEIFINPVYENNTNTAFSYRAGLGIDIDIFNHLRLGVGYRFVDWGKAELGTGYLGNVVLDNTLEQPHIYSNGGEVQLTLII